MSERPFDLEPVDLPKPPDVPGIVNMLESADEAIDLALRDVLELADVAVGERGRFDLAVSGDPQLDAVWLRMMLDPDLRTFPWHATHLWFSDARGAAESVRGRLQEALILPSGLQEDHVHPLSGEPTHTMRDELEQRPLDAAMLAVAADGDVVERLPAAEIERATLLSILAIGHTGVEGLHKLGGDHAAACIGRFQGKLRWYVG